MPGKKKKSKKAERPPLNGPTDSLRADIAAAQDAEDDDDDGEDIAAQLLASLDARDEHQAEIEAAPQDDHSKTSHHRSPSAVLHGLKEAGEKLLHPSRSPQNDKHHHHSGAMQSPPPTTLPPPVASSSTSTSPPDQQPRKMGRQKLRKQRKEAEAAADRARFEEELKANGGNPDEADLERKGIDVACQSLGVSMHEINPDGHCLYAAIADQYNLLYHHKTDYQRMRKTTSEHMKSHRDDFLPFISDGDEKMAGITNLDAGKRNNDDAFLAYCDAIESTGVWGGQPEILALSQALDVPIWVVQSDSPTLKIGESKRKPLLISYHRKMYGLGEHYNSLWPLSHSG